MGRQGEKAGAGREREKGREIEQTCPQHRAVHQPRNAGSIQSLSLISLPRMSEGRITTTVMVAVILRTNHRPALCLRPFQAQPHSILPTTL